MMKRKGYIVLRYMAALAVAVSILAPMLWLFLMSVSTTADLTRVPLAWIPRQWDFSRYGHLLSLAPGEPGALFLPALGNSLLVAAGEGAVRLLQVQGEGGKPMAAQDFLRGRPMTAGQRMTEGEGQA